MVMPEWFTYYEPQAWPVWHFAGTGRHLVLTPDTLVIRMSGLERWTLMGWRGILMGVMSFAIWWVLFAANHGAIYAFYDMARAVCDCHIQPEFCDIYPWHCRNICERGVNSGGHHASICGDFICFCYKNDKAGAAGQRFCRDGGCRHCGGRRSQRHWPADGSVILGALYGVLTAIGRARYLCSQISMAGDPASRRIWGLYQRHDRLCCGTRQNVRRAVVDDCMGLILLPVSFTCLNLAPRYTSAAVVSLVMR